MKNNLWLIFLCSNFVLAQPLLEKQYRLADSLFQQKNYYDAVTEYKRLQFFDHEKKFLFETNFKIGLCYKAGAKFDEAVNYFSAASQKISDSEKIFQAKIEIIKTNILRRTITRALQVCDEIENTSGFASKKEEVAYWRGWAFMFDDNWEKAAEYFSKNGNLELTKLCRNVQSEKVSVTFAKVISYFLPGAGQVYSGEVLSGLMSLAWNILAGYLTVNAFVEQRAFDGIVTGDLLWLRFYHGNIQNAERFAIDRNLRVANKALIYLQNEYKGLQP